MVGANLRQVGVPAVFLAAMLALSACGAAPQVKTLSTAQLGYFDTALESIRIQSEALLVAADRIRSDAEAAIDRREEEEKADFARSVAADIGKLSPADRESLARRYLESASLTLAKGAESRARLERGRADIAAKSAELYAYIAQMQAVQRALDGYIQSEQAGDRVVREVLEQPSVASLLATANALVPRVTTAANELKTLIAALPVPSGGGVR